MKESIWGLIIFFSLALLCYYLFRPVNGWYWLIKDGAKNEKKIIEDILKEVYTLENKNLTPKIDLIKEHLQIPEAILEKALKTMLEKNLIIKENTTLSLTTSGTDYALQIIRAHRLYEKYLAEQTGYAPAEWHSKAEEMEHHLKGKALEKIIDAVGDPRYDPHGDPIPTSEGKIRNLKGIPLSELKTNDMGRIIHIEDEPMVVYKQIIAENIHIGAMLRVVETSENKIAFHSEGEEFILIPEIAKNITVLPTEKIIDEDEKNTIRLSALKNNEEAEVIAISRECRGPNRRRLLDLGFVKGSKVSVDLTSPQGNPRAYLIRNASIALRNDQASHILIKKPIHNV